MPGSRREDRGVAALGRPLHIAGQVGEERLRPHVFERVRLRFCAHQSPDDMSAAEQQVHDQAAKPSVGTRDKDDHPVIVAEGT
jgi:hypothetical protein